MIQHEITETAVEELTNTLNILESNLEEFRKKIEPEVSKLGYNIAYTTFKFSSNVQMNSMNNYDKVISDIYNKGYYTNADLNSLDNALRTQNVAQQAMAWGAILAGVVYYGGKIYVKVKEYFVKRKMIDYIRYERNRFNIVNSLITESSARLDSNYKIKRSIFEKIGTVINLDSEIREQNILKIKNLVDSFKKYSEIKYRMEYVLDVYNTINNFDFDQFKESLKNLLFVGVQKKALYLIKSTDYVQEIEFLLNKTNWEAPFYKNGLPDIVIFSLRNRKNIEVFPYKYKSEILDKIVKKVRKETFIQINPIIHFSYYRYIKGHYMNTSLFFRYHIIALITIIIIAIPIIFQDNISEFISTLLAEN